MKFQDIPRFHVVKVGNKALAYKDTVLVVLLNVQWKILPTAIKQTQEEYSIEARTRSKEEAIQYIQLHNGVSHGDNC